MDLSPLQTRRQRQIAQALGRDNSAAETKTASPSTTLTGRSTTHSKPSTAVGSVKHMKALSESLNTKETGLKTSDLRILRKKQAWLRNYKIALPEDEKSLQPAVDATLVFAQEEAGTAVCISTDGILLTCSHCIAESADELDMEKLHCLIFASGVVVQARCSAWDSKRDLALLEVVAAQGDTAKGFPSISVATRPPKNQDALLCVGHPGSDDLETSIPGIKTNYDTLHASVGHFRGYAKGQDLQDNSEIGALKHDCWTYWGHSGAPLILRANLGLIGIHSSWDQSTGMRRGIPLDAIHEFLQEHKSPEL